MQKERKKNFEKQVVNPQSFSLAQQKNLKMMFSTWKKKEEKSGGGGGVKKLEREQLQLHYHNHNSINANYH